MKIPYYNRKIVSVIQFQRNTEEGNSRNIFISLFNKISQIKLQSSNLQFIFVRAKH